MFANTGKVGFMKVEAILIRSPHSLICCPDEGLRIWLQRTASWELRVLSEHFPETVRPCS